jgi:hypothetical protein
MTEAAISKSRLLQMRLSDALLLAAIPAIASLLLHAWTAGAFSREALYICCGVAIIPAGIVGLPIVNVMECRGIARASGLIVCALLAIGAGLIILSSTLRSRMAEHQTQAAASCFKFAQAQEAYHRTDWDGDGVLEYAPTLAELCNRGLLPPEYANAEGLPGVAAPVKGYVFKVFLAQGPNATGGAFSYLVGSNMTRGYAMLACPADYDDSGRDSFMISNGSSIFQGDLGLKTSDIMRDTTTFDPQYKVWWGGG